VTARPFATLRKWIWKDGDRTQIPGIGIFHGDRLRAHLTPDEARKMADNLHDMADELQAQSEPRQ
jgi:hypothetical protein